MCGFSCVVLYMYQTVQQLSDMDCIYRNHIVPQRTCFKYTRLVTEFCGTRLQQQTVIQTLAADSRLVFSSRRSSRLQQQTVIWTLAADGRLDFSSRWSSRLQQQTVVQTLAADGQQDLSSKQASSLWQKTVDQSLAADGRLVFSRRQLTSLKQQTVNYIYMVIKCQHLYELLWQQLQGNRNQYVTQYKESCFP